MEVPNLDRFEENKSDGVGGRDQRSGKKIGVELGEQMQKEGSIKVDIKLQNHYTILAISMESLL